MSIINILIWFGIPIIVVLFLLTSIIATWYYTTGWVFSILVTVEVVASILFSLLILMFKDGIHVA